MRHQRFAGSLLIGISLGLLACSGNTETPDAPEEMPSASEDSEVSLDQPIKFKEEYVVSVSMGSIMGLGPNISNQFSGGLNFQADLSTPFSFSGITVMGHASMFTLAASGDNYSGSSYNNTNTVEEYNGVSWTTVNTISTSFRFGVGAGLQSQAIIFGGHDGSSNSAALSQEYDGTTWARSNHMLTGRNSLGAFGNSMYGALAMGGDSGTSTKAVEEYQRGGVYAFVIS